jgi:hypothetical protein
MTGLSVVVLWCMVLRENASKQILGLIRAMRSDTTANL